MNKESKELPYIKKRVSTTVYAYNPNYGDGRICICGHEYYRHFDSYPNIDNKTMEPIGCKYCPCYRFEERLQPNN
jgi:hypothetical protein